MSNKNFGQFTQESSPTTAQFVVGYNTAVSGGERRFALSDVLGLFRTQVFSTANGILQADGAGNVTSTGLTYSGNTLSVPDGFVVSSAGSISFTAGGSNKNITLTPSGTGSVVLANGTATNPGISFTGNTGTTGFYWAGPGVVGYASTGAASLAFNAGGIIAGTSSNSITLNSSGAVALAAGGTNQNVTITPSGTGFVSIVGAGIRLDGTAKSLLAWGVSGPSYSALARTYTDSSSSGTVATAVANSFAVPTFAASGSPSDTIFTNAANLYIGGDVAAGAHVTLTNSYGLWNVGKTRLDGRLNITDATEATTSAGSIFSLGGASFTKKVFASEYNLLNGGRIFDDGTGAIRLNASGSNQNISMVPTGSGYILVQKGSSGAVIDGFRIQNSAGSATGNAAMVRLWVNGSAVDSTNAVDLRAIQTAGGTTDFSIWTGLAQGATFSGGAAVTFTGGAGNMTITAGTGNSRTLTLQTTTSGGTATNALVLSATQNATFGGSVTTSAPNGGTAGAWKMGILVSATVALDTTRYIQLDVGGTLYKVLIST